MIEVELVKLLADRQGGPEPAHDVPLFSGNLTAIPTTTSAICRLAVRKLLAILHHHGYPTRGGKDQLTIRVYLLRHNHQHAMFAKEERELQQLVNILQELVLTEREANLLHIKKRRTFSTDSVPTATQQLHIPGIELCELHNVLNPLLAHVAITNQVRNNNKSPTISGQPTIRTYGNNREELKEMIMQVGDG